MGRNEDEDDFYNGAKQEYWKNVVFGRTRRLGESHFLENSVSRMIAGQDIIVRILLITLKKTASRGAPYRWEMYTLQYIPLAQTIFNTYHTFR